MSTATKIQKIVTELHQNLELPEANTKGAWDDFAAKLGRIIDAAIENGIRDHRRNAHR